MNLYVVRHGETEWNRARRIQGHTDSPLTELGRRQATAASQVVASLPITTLYTSDMPRALETSRLLLGERQLPVKVDPRLREMSYGILEGLSWDEIESKHPEAHQGLSERPGVYVPPEGESREMVLARALSALHEIARSHPGETVLVVSHGGLISGFLRHVLGIPFTTPSGFYTANCAIHRFEWLGERFRLRSWGLEQHLHGLEP